MSEVGCLMQLAADKAVDSDLSPGMGRGFEARNISWYKPILMQVPTLNQQLYCMSSEQLEPDLQYLPMAVELFGVDHPSPTFRSTLWDMLYVSNASTFCCSTHGSLDQVVKVPRQSNQ